MAEVTQLKRYDARPINWGKWFLIGIGMLVSAFILLVPMIYIFVQAFSKGLMPVLQNLADPDMLHAIWLTVMIALIAVPVNLVFGILLAWLVTRFNFPGRQLLLTLLDIPFAVLAVVAGLVYLLFYGSNGPLGGWLDEHNLQIMFSWPGMVLVTIFVTCPFVVRELVPVMLSQGSQEDEAAILRQLMTDVVQEGTASKLKGLSYTAAGKTGSAEYNNVKGDSHAWFTGFAPAEDPEVCVTIIVEGAGSGGDYAVPIARRLFDAYFSQKE